MLLISNFHINGIVVKTVQDSSAVSPFPNHPHAHLSFSLKTTLSPLKSYASSVSFDALFSFRLSNQNPIPGPEEFAYFVDQFPLRIFLFRILSPPRKFVDKQRERSRLFSYSDDLASPSRNQEYSTVKYFSSRGVEGEGRGKGEVTKVYNKNIAISFGSRDSFNICTATRMKIRNLNNCIVSECFPSRVARSENLSLILGMFEGIC